MTRSPAAQATICAPPCRCRRVPVAQAIPRFGRSTNLSEGQLGWQRPFDRDGYRAPIRRRFAPEHGQPMSKDPDD